MKNILSTTKRTYSAIAPNAAWCALETAQVSDLLFARHQEGPLKAA